MQASSFLADLVRSRFPRVCFAAGYGSGVLPQGSAPGMLATKGKMIDFLFAVDSAQEWHAMNVAKNPKDYSWIIRTVLSPGRIASIQHNYGARVWFNAMVEVGNGVSIKYGVIDTQDLLTDLNSWETLYVAGRLHKPVMVLEPGPEHVQLAIQRNRESALRAALLLLDETDTSRVALFETIASLSYEGDIRVGVAESPTKIKDIVTGSRAAFESLYLGPFSHLAVASGTDSFARTAMVSELVRGLPAGFNQCKNGTELRQALARVVRRSSASQSFKGLITGGPMVAAKYLGAKLVKRWGR